MLLESLCLPHLANRNVATAFLALLIKACCAQRNFQPTDYSNPKLHSTGLPYLTL